jgi:hypothetical protein
MKGLSFSLPHLIAATATLYYNKHVRPAVQFIEQQRALFKLVNNDLSLLGVCYGCQHYYDMTKGVKCDTRGCVEHTFCDAKTCVGNHSNPCDDCSKWFCDTKCLLRCTECTLTLLCYGCSYGCSSCDDILCDDHRQDCIVCNRDLCDSCSDLCMVCDAGPFCGCGGTYLGTNFCCISCLGECVECHMPMAKVNGDEPMTCLGCNIQKRHKKH